MLYTLSAIQILTYAVGALSRRLLCSSRARARRLLDCTDKLNVDGIAARFASLQLPDGSFMGDAFGEIDTRFSYIAIMGLSLLGRLDAINLDSAVAFILSCKNFDEAFGAVPFAESHAGQTFCCVAALAIAGALDRVDRDRLGWWLAERQLPCGGLNGRPEKKEDVCYSWWVLSALSILDRLSWIDGNALARFILSCQVSSALLNGL